MIFFLLSLFLGCFSNQDEVYFYRPKEAKEPSMEQTVEEKKAFEGKDQDLRFRPRHMPCTAMENRIKNGITYRTWKWFFSYDSKGRLEFANSIEFKSGKLINEETRDKLFWNSRYEYDENDRLIRYLHLTERNLLVWWEVQYTNLNRGSQVLITGKQEPESCLSVASPFIHSRKCFQEPIVVERLMFAFDANGRALSGKIESKWRNLLSGTRLQFEHGVDTLLGGNITFFGWEFVIGQKRTFVGRAKEWLYDVDYDKEDDGSILRIRSPTYTKIFKSGEMCEK